MLADGADLGRLLADDDVTAVAALPDGDVFADEHRAAFYLGKQLSVTLLVLLFNVADHLKKGGDLREAFLFGFFGESGVHIRPLVILAVWPRPAGWQRYPASRRRAAA